MTWILTFQQNELKYDIEFITYKVAKIHLEDERPEAAAAVATNREDADFIDRLVTSAIANVENELNWCIDRRIHHFAANNQIEPGVKQYHILLQVNEDWKENMKALNAMIHDYIVNYAVFRLLIATMPHLAPAYESLAENALNKAYNLLRTNRKLTFYSLWNVSK